MANDNTTRDIDRAKAEMLDWYGRRMLNAANSLWFTAAFGISKELIDPVAKNILKFFPDPHSALVQITPAGNSTDSSVLTASRYSGRVQNPEWPQIGG